MIRNLLKVALRNIRRHKAQTFINVLNPVLALRSE
jgi:hypothetical protein